MGNDGWWTRSELATRHSPAESFIFTGTLASLDKDFRVTDAGVDAQVAYTLQLLRNVLDDVGATLDDVLVLNLYIVNAPSVGKSVIEGIRAAFNPESMPSFCVVGITELLLPALHFKLSAIAIKSA